MDDNVASGSKLGARGSKLPQHSFHDAVAGIEGGVEHAAGSLPPASAMSGRPPPEPPTFFATSAMILPACTRAVRSFVTPTISATLPSLTDPMTTTPDPSLLRRLSTSVRSCVRSRLSARVARTFTPFTSRTFSVADETDDAADFMRACSSSRFKRLISSSRFSNACLSALLMFRSASSISSRRRETSSSPPHPAFSSAQTTFSSFLRSFWNSRSEPSPVTASRGAARRWRRCPLSES